MSGSGSACLFSIDGANFCVLDLFYSALDGDFVNIAVLVRAAKHDRASKLARSCGLTVYVLV